MIKGTPSSGFGVAGGASVEMVGSTSGHSKGTVLKFKAVATYEGGGSIPDILLPCQISGPDDKLTGVKPSINQMLILPDPHPDPKLANQPMHFLTRGDSGAVLVNSAKEVVGIVSRRLPVTPAVRERRPRPEILSRS